MDEKVKKEDCEECKDLAEGEVTEGHDHTVVEENGGSDEESTTGGGEGGGESTEEKTEESTEDNTEEETTEEKTEEAPVEEVKEEVVEETQVEEKENGDVVEITGEEAQGLREQFNTMHRTHRGEIKIGHITVVCKG